MSHFRAFSTLLYLLWLTPSPVMANSYCKHLEGALVYAQDENKTFLGVVHHRSLAQSIFDKNGPYGSPTSPTSIWNKRTIYGDESSEYSALNPFAPKPPVMVKGDVIIGHISKNLNNLNSITGFYLTIICRQFLN